MLGLLLMSAVMVTIISCGDDQSPGPTEGTILIGARTTGTDLDVDGYSISVNGRQEQEIGHLDTIYVPELDPGDYVVSLADVADNCTLPAEDNPQETTVVPGDTVEVLFDITCGPIEPDDGGGGNLLRTRR
ncbi:MAG TPA: hypothetical protein VJ808_04875 [Gemmatimonadales bacterium]|nr:hypothetical protein [Gemmatimonadales bacterium]